MRFLMVSVAALLVSCSGQNGSGGNEVVKLATENDSLSYAYGADIGRKVRSQLETMKLDMNPEVVSGAVKDVLTLVDLRMSDDEMKAAFQNYSHKREKDAGAGQATGSGSAYEQAQANLAAGNAFLAENGKKDGVVVLPSGLQYRVITPGSGASPGPSDRVTVHYAGTLLDGTEFDSSYKRGETIAFSVTGVIKGWTEGLQLMKEGATFEFFIPADLAYGSRGRPAIPPNSTLIFKVELVKVN